MNMAIIVAAGKGLRMGADRPKQYLELDGRPVLTHSLMAFDASDEVEKLYLVVAADDTHFCQKKIIDPAGLRTPIVLVAGGQRRQDSVFNGIEAISDSEGIILIHDGVRPLVSVETIETCINGAKKSGSCIPAIVPVDTPKQVDGNGVITHTIARNTLRMAQTPQAFQLPIIRKAYREANLKGWQATDDASLVERMGEKVHIIPGNQQNLKITTPQDLELARIYLSRRFPVEHRL
jgi:2-C-methyl-D-erythritol 4-phosphate cytidylyltransferase